MAVYSETLHLTVLKCLHYAGTPEVTFESQPGANDSGVAIRMDNKMALISRAEIAALAALFPQLPPQPKP